MSNYTPSFGRWPKDGGTDSSLQQHLEDTIQWYLWFNWRLFYLLLPSKAWPFSLILWFLSTVYLRATQYIFFFHKLAKWFSLLGNQKSLNNKNFLGKRTCGLPQVDCHFLLQGTFLTQGSNPGLPHCRQTLYPLSHQGSPRIWPFKSLEISHFPPGLAGMNILTPHPSPALWILVCACFSSPGHKGKCFSNWFTNSCN